MTIRRACLLCTLALAVVISAGTARAQRVGDADCDGEITAQDEQALLERLYVPDDCGNADANLDGWTSAADLIALEQLIVLPTPTPTATPTATPGLGPRLTYLGVATAAGVLLTPSEYTTAGTPIIDRFSGSGFRIVVEAAPGQLHTDIGRSVFNSVPGDPTALPDLQIVSSRSLGNGSPVVCNDGGVPGFDPPRFDGEQAIADAVNDLACRFTVATTRGGVCTVDAFDTFNFASPDSRQQFCLLVTQSTALPPGDTHLLVRVRDILGNLSAPAEVIVRIPGGTPTATPSQTSVPPTRTPTSTRTPSATRTPTYTAAVTSTPSPTATRTATRTPTSTPPPTATSFGTRTPTSATSTPTRSGTATATRTASASPSASATRTRTASPTRTVPPPSPTPTQTPAPTARPVITFFGLTYANNTLIVSTESAPDGIPIYDRPVGSGFNIVVEGKKGIIPGPPDHPGPALGQSSYEPGDRPDLQIEVNRSLGNGSPAVCDNTPPDDGGIPAINPPDFSETSTIDDTLNDFGCRFVDGSGEPKGRTSDGCVLFDNGEFGFVSADSIIQFCGGVNPIMLFPRGDTLVSVRLRDVNGATSEVSKLIVRVP